MKPNSFDVLKTMSEESQDIRLAPLSNILRVQKVKAGTQITIGVAGDVIAGIANGDFVGGLYLADRKQFEETQERLAVRLATVTPFVPKDTDVCAWCYATYSEHVVAHLPGQTIRVPCGRLRAYFIQKDGCVHCGRLHAEHFDPKDYPYHGNLPRVACLMLKTNFNLRKDGA